MGEKYKEQIDGIQSTLHSWWERKIVCPVVKIDDYVELVFREHNPEEDQMANLGTEGKAKITIEGVKNTGKWKAMRRYWDGSKKRRWKEWMWNCDQSR